MVLNGVYTYRRRRGLCCVSRGWREIQQGCQLVGGGGQLIQQGPAQGRAQNVNEAVDVAGVAHTICVQEIRHRLTQHPSNL